MPTHMSKWNFHIKPLGDYIEFSEFLSNMMNLKGCLCTDFFFFGRDILEDILAKKHLPSNINQESYDLCYFNFEERERLLKIANFSDKQNEFFPVTAKKNSTTTQTKNNKLLTEDIKFQKISFKAHITDSNVGSPSAIKVTNLTKHKSFPFKPACFVRLYHKKLKSELSFVPQGKIKDIDADSPIRKIPGILRDCISRSEIYDELYHYLRGSLNLLYFYDQGEYHPIKKSTWDNECTFITLLTTSCITKATGEEKVVPIFIKTELAHQLYSELGIPMTDQLSPTQINDIQDWKSLYDEKCGEMAKLEIHLESMKEECKKNKKGKAGLANSLNMADKIVAGLMNNKQIPRNSLISTTLSFLERQGVAVSEKTLRTHYKHGCEILKIPPELDESSDCD